MNDIKQFLSEYNLVLTTLKTSRIDKKRFYRNVIKEAKLLLMKYDIPFPNYGTNLAVTTLKGILDHYMSLLKANSENK